MLLRACVLPTLTRRPARYQHLCRGLGQEVSQLFVVWQSVQKIQTTLDHVSSLSRGCEHIHPHRLDSPSGQRAYQFRLRFIIRHCFTIRVLLFFAFTVFFSVCFFFVIPAKAGMTRGRALALQWALGIFVIRH